MEKKKNWTTPTLNSFKMVKEMTKKQMNKRIVKKGVK